MRAFLFGVATFSNMLNINAVECIVPKIV